MKAIPRVLLWTFLMGVSAHVCAEPDQITTSYTQAITAAVNAAVHRPSIEMRQNETGLITVSFDCTDNVVAHLKIDKSSQELSFDKAALNAVKTAKFPAVPAELRHKTVHVSVEVRIPAAS